jgi:hypothetical protein
MGCLTTGCTILWSQKTERPRQGGAPPPVSKEGFEKYKRTSFAQSRKMLLEYKKGL